MCTTESLSGERDGQAVFDEKTGRKTEDRRNQEAGRGRKPQVKTSLNLATCEIFLCLGDICEEDTMCIIHPTDEGMQNNMDFSQYLLNKAGSKVKAEIEQYKNRNKFKVGHIFMTSGGNLKAKNIIHLIAPRYVNGEMNEEKHLQQAIYSLLRFIDQAKLISFSCPLVGVTNGRYPLKVSVQMCFKALHRYFFRHKETTIQVIRIVSKEEKEVTIASWSLMASICG